jgi:hypothetical protein
MRASVRVAAGLVAVLVCASIGSAADHPIDGLRLVLKRSPTKSSLVFVTRDPTFLFPAIGGPDDPSTGGATIEVFSPSEGSAAVQVPAGVGTPGWTVKSEGQPQYKFKNPDAPAGVSPVKLALLKSAKVLKVVSKDALLALSGAQGTVGIRITTGTLRNCALFDAPTIRKDETGVFSARNASAAVLTDCSDGSLLGGPPTGSCEASPFPDCSGTCSGDGACAGGLGSCFCISPSSPCGDTSPMCSGTCPDGEECVAYAANPLPACQCLPPGVTPCGDPGPPTCGGACPASDVCATIFTSPVFGGQPACACGQAAPCGPNGIQCPPGYGCALIPPGNYLCAPL